MDPDFTHTKAPINLGNHVWVGTGATILPGVSLGDGAVVGAGAVVAKSVPPHAIVVGNPARVIRDNRPSDLRYVPALWFAPFEAWTGKAGTGELASAQGPTLGRP